MRQTLSDGAQRTTLAFAGEPETDATVVVASDAEQGAKIDAVRPALAKVKHFITFSPKAPAGWMTFDEVCERGAKIDTADPGLFETISLSAKPDDVAAAVDESAKKEMRAFRDDMTLADPSFLDYVREFRSPWSVTMQTIWPNLIVQREMNTLGIRHIGETTAKDLAKALGLEKRK